MEIDADGGIHLKDEDELVAAIEQGRLSPEQAAQIERHADAAIASFEADDWPFDAEWRHWQPDPVWTVPVLAGLDQLGPRADLL
ncbi:MULTISPECIES: hypothetical protein [unclassified Microbacterium]|uniref:hypothetical protein n=1 Tax=unclassified Microbacterium TaxID=2609290 RepID=UPI000CFA9F45|nr:MULTISPECIES: hypothetical protein [unclassified Microbacterium]PQZ52708.1 hypothetical protein CQ032_16740 [Microbacterium sp. MYb43]PQZ74357.1 hypothetical protein CQ031_15940 [Microbacterium sp. MYb40]PRB18140.1 hypothetical protein CQ040_17330 [Microbacterium sp. MYb54]PRB23483.1 hypothetical protein CQ037_17530 [Microbacterium sp. MYb50]PRB62120.1 hypothetical protein CQ021_17355 [Microbacterium sp. MYb24]